MHTGEALGGKGRFIWFLSGISLFLLYVSGLLRWLYRTGKLRDRPVNFTVFRATAYRLKALSYRVILQLLMLFDLYLKNAKRHWPSLKIQFAKYLEWCNQQYAKISSKKR